MAMKLEKGLEKGYSIIESNVTETTDGLILTALVSNTKNIATEEKMLISYERHSSIGAKIKTYIDKKI
jgi:hypothetical protein